uniref:Uncharacterized protein n=1 Tax=viral metagenome TaxID=1070528 RepID=A0A6C0F8T4_9ZZZZ|tara:strand:+ start:6440 stop:6985 length:546 start_codon:yes stop_codon:yes gene_type:complete
MASLQAFTSVMDEFLCEMKNTFPEEKQIKVYYNSFITLKKINPRKILEEFMTNIQPYVSLISSKDEKFFLESDHELMEKLNVKKWWTPELSDKTKDAIWQYLNTLILLGTTISNIPANLLSTIEGVAEQCASQMQGNTEQMNPESMNSLLSGMQSMLGGLLNQTPETPKKSKSKSKKSKSK